MKMLACYLVILANSFIGFPEILYAAEQAPSGNDVLRDCSLALDMTKEDYMREVLGKNRPLPSKALQIQAAQCLNYVIGFKDALYVSQLFQEKNESVPLTCLPENNLNNGQALRTVIKYLRDNPQLLDRPQAAVVFNAFYYGYPCKK